MKRILAILLTVMLLIGITAFASAEQTATVKGGWLRMRSAPDFTAETIASYYTGTKLTVLSKSGSWYYVQSSEGLKGYMYGSYLTISGSSSTPTTPTTGEAGYVTSANGRGVRLRATPAVTATNVIGLYNVGTRVTILSRGSTWYYVQIGNTNTVGYMMAQYITTSSVTPTPVTPTTGYNAWVYAANGRPVRLRQGPGTNYAVIATYSVGTQVMVLSHGAAWDQVRVMTTGTVGYMMNSYLTTSRVNPTPVTPTTGTIASVSVSNVQPTVGETLYPIVSPSGADYTCQWYNDNGTLLSTANSYQVKNGDRSHALRVVVTGKGSWSGSMSSGYTAAVGTVTPATYYLSNVTITAPATPAVGDTLTATLYPAEATANLNWYRDNGVLVGSGASYTVQSADVGRRLYCAASGTGVWTGTVVSTSSGVVIAPAVVDQALNGSVSIPNGAVVGTQLIPSLVLNSWDVDYAWYQNGVLISTDSTLTLTESMVGDDIRLVVTARTGSGYQGSVGSNYCYVQQAASGSPGIWEI